MKLILFFSFCFFHFYFQGVRRLDLVPSFDCMKRGRSDSNTSYVSDKIENDNIDINIDNNIDNNNNNNYNENIEINENKNVEKNDKNDKIEKNKIVPRNGGLEFSLFLDEDSTVDLYLELLSGVKKECYDDNLVHESFSSSSGSSGGGSGGESGSVNVNNNAVTSKNSNGNNNDNNGNVNGSSNGNHINNKTKFDHFEYNYDNQIIKKQKTTDSNCTHTLFNSPKKNGNEIENENIIGNEINGEIEKDKNHKNGNIVPSSGDFQNYEKTENNGNKNEENQENDSYSSKFLDKETHVRLCGMYEQCAGVELECLVLSSDMLMLMGYPGCDGEEGE